ncbi:MAG: hypothetical protein N4A41_12175 [Crocinitomicaceae bacterium]|jgi:hypothetical protein|nr:hypothetical protein [Crocinitomicaceae bacterium]
MKRSTIILIVAISAIVIVACESNAKIKIRTLCAEHSEWRDNDGADSCSYFSKKVACENIIGKLNIRSRLHKGALENGVFEGGMSSRWLEIEENSIVYYAPDGKIADKGSCNCSDGVLKVNWEKGDNLPAKAEIYFNSESFVELRYYDYPFSFDTFTYDTLKPKNNPTKIIGTIE